MEILLIHIYIFVPYKSDKKPFFCREREIHSKGVKAVKYSNSCQSSVIITGTVIYKMKQLFFQQVYSLKLTVIFPRLLRWESEAADRGTIHLDRAAASSCCHGSSFSRRSGIYQVRWRSRCHGFRLPVTSVVDIWPIVRLHNTKGPDLKKVCGRRNRDGIF
jgi:hypothetical protein